MRCNGSGAPPLVRGLPAAGYLCAGVPALPIRWEADLLHACNEVTPSLAARAMRQLEMAQA